jgi:hypothetical protein
MRQQSRIVSGVMMPQPPLCCPVTHNSAFVLFVWEFRVSFRIHIEFEFVLVLE